MITSSLLALIALAASPMSAHPTEPARSMGVEAPFQDITFDQALAAAKKDQKIVMVDFFTTWCVPCKKLDKVTWKDADVQAWLAKTAVALKIDAEKEVELAKKFKIESYPTILFVKSDGTEIDRILGFKEPADFVREATSALAGKDAVARVKEKMLGQQLGPNQRQKLGQAYAQQGKKEEALTEYLWCYDHGLESEPSYTGVRQSFLLMSIVDLGNKYPPAVQALEQRRDAAKKKLESGAGDFQTASDLMSLNRALKAPEQTLAVYDQLKRDGKLTPEMKPAFNLTVLDSLLAARRYSDVVDAVGDVEAAVKKSIANYSQVEKLLKDRSDGKETEDTGVAFLKKKVIDDGGKYYEALLGTNQPKTAESVADLLIAFDANVQTYISLLEHAIEAGANDGARALVERGLKALPEKEQERLKYVAKRIPDKK
jgi:thiol-disulfide isomerase/thioredoxin